jgi:hypothetical protein
MTNTIIPGQVEMDSASARLANQQSLPDKAWYYSHMPDKKTSYSDLATGLLLDESRFMSLSQAIEDESKTHGFGDERERDYPDKELAKFIRSITPGLYKRFELELPQEAPETWLFRALQAIFLKMKTKHLSLASTKTSPTSPKASDRLILRDITIIVRRLGQPEHFNLGINATDFCRPVPLGTVQAENLTGAHINEGDWWQQMVVEEKDFKSASEEVCFYHVRKKIDVTMDSTSLQQAFRAAIADALSFGRRELVFLIRPKASKDGKELLGAPGGLGREGSTIAT